MNINGNNCALKKDFIGSSLCHSSCELVFILRFCNCCCCRSVVLFFIRLSAGCSASCLLIGVFVVNVFIKKKSTMLFTTLLALRSITIFWSVPRSLTIETQFSNLYQLRTFPYWKLLKASWTFPHLKILCVSSTFALFLGSCQLCVQMSWIPVHLKVCRPKSIWRFCFERLCTFL